MFRPNYQISNKVLNNLMRIATLKTFIEQSNIVPKQEIILKRKAAIRMAASSTAIEGNVLNENEVERVFEGKHTHAPDKDALEVKNYKRGIEFVNKILVDNLKLDHHLVLHIHKILMAGLLPDEKLGKYRSGPVYVVNLGATAKNDKLLYTAPKAEEVRHHVGDLLKWVDEAKSEELSLVIIAALFHYQFVTIHPFTDGNGRTTRLLTTYLLYQGGLDLDKIYALDSYYNQDRLEYYKQLDVGKTFALRKKANLTPWLEYFTTGFVWELERIREQIHILKVQTKDDQHQTIYLDQDEIRIIDFLASMGRITSTDVMDILKVSKRSAQLKIKELLDNGLIEKRSQGPASYYVMVNKH